MRTLTPELQAHLATGATTLSWCWRITRNDGVRLGFTDHDRNLAFDGTTFEAASGFTASEMRAGVGLEVDNLEVESALTSQSLNESDLAAGLYDDARVEIFRVNWQDPAQRVQIQTGSIGEIRRNRNAFTAEVRGLSHYLDQERGRSFQATCDADLGDARCGFDLDQGGFTASGSVATVVSRRRFASSGLETFAPDWFTRGLLTWTSGGNAGRAIEVKMHGLSVGSATIELWQPTHADIAPGDEFSVTAGCDKRFETCRVKFANTVNFRGFPHMPGNDFVTSYPNSDDA